MNFYLAKKVPVEFEHGSNTGEGAFAETDEEVELVDGEANIGSGRKLQHVDVTPPAQQGNVVGNVHRGNFNLQAIMLRHEMAMFELYMRRHLQAPYFPAAMPFSLPVNRKRPANVLPIEVAGETIAAMTGFIIGLHREKKRTRYAVILSAASRGSQRVQATDPELPRVFLLDGMAMVTARRQLVHPGSPLQPILVELRSHGDRLLVETPISVMDKTQVPFSGDKHDFMSIGPYWWPDPDKPDGLPWISRDGHVNPTARGQGSDASAMHHMTTTVEGLAVAYFFTLDERYAERAVLWLRTWFLAEATRMNPHLEFVEAVGLLQSARTYTPADHQGLHDWFTSFRDWLLDSGHGKDEARAKNNHGTFYDVQIAHFSLFIGDQERARNLLKTVVEQCLRPQLAADGSQPHELKRPRPVHYTLFNLQAMYALARLGEHVQVDIWGAQRGNTLLLQDALASALGFIDQSRVEQGSYESEAGYDMLIPLLLLAEQHYPEAHFGAAIPRYQLLEIYGGQCLLLFPLRSSLQALLLPFDSANVVRHSCAYLCTIEPEEKVHFETSQVT
ncbi:alginate lyase-domain containing protein [Nitzschia inconspicua]|uniref:Alginate lyase-domain containing protein n=1 Tax=Nitzschia inconspicua TaxID=303405 RepID=A0A9K3KL31_9STRA|nr:alginate lyase-domain containing protein [Nitzschia inconspicua]